MTLLSPQYVASIKWLAVTEHPFHKYTYRVSRYLLVIFPLIFLIQETNYHKTQKSEKLVNHLILFNYYHSVLVMLVAIFSFQMKYFFGYWIPSNLVYVVHSQNTWVFKDCFMALKTWCTWFASYDGNHMQWNKCLALLECLPPLNTYSSPSF